MTTPFIVLVFVAAANYLLNQCKKSNSNSSAPDTPVETKKEADENDSEEQAVENFRSIQKKLRLYFNVNDVRYYLSDDSSLYRLSFQNEPDPLLVFVRVAKNGPFLTFSSLLYHNVPDAKLNKVAELITRLNAGLVIGNLNLYHESGKVFFETSILLEEVTLSQTMIHWNLGHALNAVELYKSALYRVIEQDEEPVLVLIDHFTTR